MRPARKEAESCDPASREEGRGFAVLDLVRSGDRNGHRDRLDHLEDGSRRNLEPAGFHRQDRPLRLAKPPPPNGRLGPHHRVEQVPQTKLQDRVEVVHL